MKFKDQSKVVEIQHTDGRKERTTLLELDVKFIKEGKSLYDIMAFQDHIRTFGVFYSNNATYKIINQT